MKKYFLYFLGIIIVIALVSILPIFPRNSSLLRKCKFDESSGSYSKCFWVWDKQLKEPSTYF